MGKETKIVYSYRELDDIKGKLRYTNDPDMAKEYPETFGISGAEQRMVKKDKSSPPPPPTPDEAYKNHQKIGCRFKKDGTVDKRFKNRQRVIIVGNSPSILLEKNGSFIDSHDIVIRINKCVTKGFEEYIGSKTDIWATSYNDRHYSETFVPDNYEQLSYIWKRAPKIKLVLPDSPEILEEIMYKGHGSKRNRWGVSRISVEDWWNTYKIKEFKAEPCTGLLTILTATRFFNDITILGFTFNQEKKDKDVTWYYRESEADREGKHYEDQWAVKQKKGKFVSEGVAKQKRAVIKQLINEKKINELNPMEMKL